jgi:hypothetical protein
MYLSLAAVSSSVLNYSGQSREWFAVGDVPLIVHFWTPSSTAGSVHQFDLASSMIPGVTFMRINCTVNRSVCDQHKSDLPYSIRLLRPSLREFTGEEIAFDLLRFLEAETGISPSVNVTLPSVNSSSFRPFLRTQQSAVVAFLDLRHRQSELVLPQMWQLSFIFARERAVGVAFVNCSGDIQFCRSVHVSAAPTIRIYVDDQIMEFEGTREFDRILWFVNANLHTFRMEDGELNDAAAIVPNVFPFVQHFMASDSKLSVMQSVSQIAGAEYYFSVMKKLLKGGESVLQTETRKYEARAAKAVDKPGLRDEAVRHLNVLAEFHRAGPYVPPRQDL